MIQITLQKNITINDLLKRINPKNNCNKWNLIWLYEFKDKITLYIGLNQSLILLLYKYFFIIKIIRCPKAREIRLKKPLHQKMKNQKNVGFMIHKCKQTSNNSTKKQANQSFIKENWCVV